MTWHCTRFVTLTTVQGVVEYANHPVQCMCVLLQSLPPVRVMIRYFTVGKQCDDVSLQRERGQVHWIFTSSI